MILTYVHFRSLLWLGPALLFSTATSVNVLGWDGIVRTILSISMPYSGIFYLVLVTWSVNVIARYCGSLVIQFLLYYIYSMLNF